MNMTSQRFKGLKVGKQLSCITTVRDGLPRCDDDDDDDDVYCSVEQCEWTLSADT